MTFKGAKLSKRLDQSKVFERNVLLLLFGQPTNDRDCFKFKWLVEEESDLAAEIACIDSNGCQSKLI